MGCIGADHIEECEGPHCGNPFPDAGCRHYSPPDYSSKFDVGKCYFTKSGKGIIIVAENDFPAPYACVKGDDGKWRYRHDGQCTGPPFDMSDPHNLLPVVEPEELEGNMQINPVEHRDDIRKGDILLIDDGKVIQSATAKRIIDLIDPEEREVVFNVRKNRYFNVDMYLRGESWVKDVRIVRFGGKEQNTCNLSE